MRSGLSLMRFAVLGLLLLFGAGCSEKVDLVFRDNMEPEVRLTQAPIASPDPYHYAYRINWVGFDPDGRIEYFLITAREENGRLFGVDPIRPDSVEATWHRTSKNEAIIFFKSSRPDSTNLSRADDYHTFAIAAVDNNGAVSKPVWRSFTSYTTAPSVFIEAPRPSTVFTPIATPVVRIRWRGIDPDGVFTTKPIKYKFKLFVPGDPDFKEFRDPVGEIFSNPKILRDRYAPMFGPNPNCPDCSYWDSLPADTTEYQYTNLSPDNLYLFAVTGFDEAGAYDPNFSPNTNVLRFAVTFAGTLGPRIEMFNEFFYYRYSSGGYSNDPTRYFNVEVPADQRVTFNWFATPPQGADMRRYRWCMDLQDLSDETPRSDETNDYRHWSTWSLQNTSATVGPFVNNGEDHLFYIEAEDNNGLKSLGIIHFVVVRATLENDILFVDDTRLTPDQRPPGGNYDPPRGVWPTAAELDTFFYAQGGFQWTGYPAGSLSPPGIFKGYPGVRAGAVVETTGTRGVFGFSGLVPLARLGKYKLVVWYTDDIGSTYSGSPVELLAPVTSLRLMSTPGQPSTVSTYLKQGGKLWLFGGGAAFATLASWNKRNTPPDEFSNIEGELIPGRFMFDFPHWQSALSLLPSERVSLNVPEHNPIWQNATPGRGWSNHGMDGTLNQPDYNKLLIGAPRLPGRQCATDPPSPLRDCNSFYIVRYFTAEFMGTKGTAGNNHIREDADPNPDVVREESTLDTLYFLGGGGSAPYGRPVMTYYHGFETPPVVFCGFPLWHFSRPQVAKVADFVLQDIFGYTKSSPPVAAAPARATATAPAGQRAQVSRPSPATPLRR